jgi:hypothetical protein
VKAGPFDIDAETAARLLAQPNPDGRRNSEVIRPWANGQTSRVETGIGGSSISVSTCLSTKLPV